MKPTRRLRLVPQIIGATCLLLVGVAVGRYSLAGHQVSPGQLTCQREPGYDFINPLLFCDPVGEADSGRFATLSSNLSSYISEQVSQKNVDQVSVFVRDINRREEFGIGADQKYFPASLGKLPVMIAVYKQAERDPAFMSRVVTTDPTDYNSGVEIQPSSPVGASKSATVADLLESMVTQSDNNAFYALARVINEKDYYGLFSTLRLPVANEQDALADIISPREVFNYFRVLYNATYLEKRYSKEALGTLAKANYKQGIAAVVPAEVRVSHKFGVHTIQQDGKLVQRQLHDCGIVYRGENPYFICVMTKSRGELKQVEGVIQEIAKRVYEQD